MIELSLPCKPGVVGGSCGLCGHSDAGRSSSALCSELLSSRADCGSGGAGIQT